MKRRVIAAVMAVLLLGVAGCSKTSTEPEKQDDVSIVDQGEDEYEEVDYGIECTEGNINIGVGFDNLYGQEVSSLEVKYLNYDTEELIETKTIQPVDVDKNYDIGISKDKLGGADGVIVEYIVNGDTENSWTRIYTIDSEGIILNVISYIQEENRFESAVCG